MIRAGSSPSECTPAVLNTAVPADPATGKAQGRNDPEARPTSLRDTDRRRESSPEANPIARGSVSQKGGSPDKNQSGRAVGRTGTWARSIRNDRSPGSGSKPAKGVEEPQERYSASRGKDHSPGQAAKARIGSGTPRQSNARCMTDVGRRINEAVALGVTGRF
jgi:hypothetical protein